MNKSLDIAKESQDTNKRLTEQTMALLPTGFPADFIMELRCECANQACAERIGVAYADYLNYLVEPGRFVVAPKHYVPEFDQLVHESLTYWVVVKRWEKIH